MAVYKVIQDIEAEDKLLGPLTLKSFIYAGIAGVLFFIIFRILVSGEPLPFRLIMTLVLFFPTALFGVLASPIGRDQPTEVWLLSHVQFFLKPHLRVWDQSGANKLVTITAPKVVTKQLTKGFSQTEVQSRLQALASTLDSHGWVVKNSAISLDDGQNYVAASQAASDRLVGPSSITQSAPVIDIHAADDILDEQNNATAQHFNELMQAADVQRKQAVLEKINQARESGSGLTPAMDSRFIDKTTTGGETTFVGKAVVAPKTDDNTLDDNDEPVSAEDRALLESWHKRDAEIHRRSASFHPKNQPAPEPPAKPQTEEPKKPVNTVTAESRADKLELAQSGNDLSVASIAHLANRKSQVEQISPNEIVISLH